jgi:hypothetical protein
LQPGRVEEQHTSLRTLRQATYCVHVRVRESSKSK